jgi:glycine C-acetyltransferase
MLNWSLNNYLGLANHPEVREADIEGSRKFGLAAPMGARMMSGNSDYHEALENGLSQLVKKEDTILCNFGYQAIVSSIDAIVDRHDVIVYDAESHACIIDGVRLHMGKRYVFKHNDVEDCVKQLERATKLAEQTGGGILVITEGVFGMRGDQGKLKEIIELKKKFNFRLLVDDAHGIGTMGPNGGGTGEEQNCQDGIDIYFGTFAKSFALIGGFISSNKEIITFLRYNMRSQIFAKSLPLPLVYGLLKRLELINKHPEYRAKLWEVAKTLQKGLVEAGFDIGVTNTMVTPVYMRGSIPEATNMVIDLRENYGIFCSMVVYPVIPKGMIILRLIPTSLHTLDDVKYTVESYSKIKDKLYGGEYAADKIKAGFSQAL